MKDAESIVEGVGTDCIVLYMLGESIPLCMELFACIFIFFNFVA